MNDGLHSALWIIGFFVLSFSCLYGLSRLSAEARYRRRRRRNYQPVRPRANRPTVMLNVKTRGRS